MAISGFIRNLTLLFVLSNLSCHIAYANPVELQKRVVCRTDNCLNQLKHSSASASPFCSSYLGSIPATTTTTTVTTTVPAYSNSPLTAFKKRSLTALASIITAPASPLLGQEELKRAPFYPSSCTENPTAVSSGCSCFLTTTSTVTSTATATSPLPTQCNAAHNYGLISNGYGYANPAQMYGFGESIKGACCARCFATPDCIAFSEFDLLVNGMPGTYAGSNCDIVLIDNPPLTTTATCPGGSVTVSLNAPDSTNYDGVGPCGIPTVVPGNVERKF